MLMQPACGTAAALQALHKFRAQRKQYYLSEHVLQKQHQYQLS
jgi:hypothetical protein